MQRDSIEWKKYMLIFVLSLIAICVYKLLDNFGEITDWIGELFKILIPFILALILAYFFYLPCKKIETMFKKSKVKFLNKKARWLSIFIVYAITILLIVRNI